MDRRVEITGPVDRKMIINALNSGAKVFMADFEDANSPTWDNNIQGQINLRDAINRSIDYISPEGKPYKLNDTIATLLVRPRGWHLIEKHLHIEAGRSRGACSILACTFSTMPKRCSPRAAARISTCPSWKAIWRRGCGTMCLCWRRMSWACRKAPSAPQC